MVSAGFLVWSGVGLALVFGLWLFVVHHMVEQLRTITGQHQAELEELKLWALCVAGDGEEDE